MHMLILSIFLSFWREVTSKKKFEGFGNNDFKSHIMINTVMKLISFHQFGFHLNPGPSSMSVEFVVGSTPSSQEFLFLQTKLCTYKLTFGLHFWVGWVLLSQDLQSPHTFSSFLFGMQVKTGYAWLSEQEPDDVQTEHVGQTVLA